ncbi:MAG: porin [Planctomycetota bacterium]
MCTLICITAFLCGLPTPGHAGNPDDLDLPPIIFEPLGSATDVMPSDRFVMLQTDDTADFAIQSNQILPEPPIELGGTMESANEGGTEVSEDNQISSDSGLKALKERLEALEKEFEAQAKKAQKEKEAKAKKSTFKLNGRVHLDQWSFFEADDGIATLEGEDPEDRWDFRRIRMEFSGTVPNNMLWRMQLDFNNPSNAEMKDVYLGFNGLPHNQTLLIGNQKRPIGLDHLNSSRHNVFSERPLAVETFNEDARRLGACMYGHTDDDSLNWQYGVFLLENINRDGRYRGDFDEGGLYGRVSASPWYDEISGGRGYLHLALAGSVNTVDGDGTVDDDDNANEARFRTRPAARSNERWWNTGRILGAQNYEQLAYEMMLNIGAFQLTSEYFGNWVQRDPFGGFIGDDLFFHGGYIFAHYFVTGEHIPLKQRVGTIDRVKPFENFFVVDRCGGGTGTGWGALGLGVRLDYLDLTDSDIQGGDGHMITAVANWYWTAYSKLQTNIGWGDIDDAGENIAGGPGLIGVDGDFSLLGMRYMIDF